VCAQRSEGEEGEGAGEFFDHVGFRVVRTK
jgi:hypothetical protein